MRTFQLLFPFIVIGTLASSVAGAADDLEALAGKWSVKKVNDQGQAYTQTIALKKNKLIFQIMGGDNNVVLYAEGDLKLERLGPFNAVHFLNIRAGRSPSDLRDVADEFVSIYRLEGDSWTVVSNFDKDRERRKPSISSSHFERGWCG